jgi:threonine dehydrogenase-like Zn-dependent dehydrogenase
MLSKAAGAEVAVFETDQRRRRMAEDYGADHAFNPLELDVARKVKDLTNGYGANMAVECTANESVVPLALESLRFKGKAVLIGMLEKPSNINGITLVRKGLTLVGSLGHSGHDSFPHVINLISRGVIDPSKLITHRFALRDARDALNLASQRGDSMKITVYP